MTKSPATCWNAGRFIGVIVRGRYTGSDCRRRNIAEALSERGSAVTLQHCSHWPRRIGSVGTKRPGRGVKWSSAQREARGGGAGRWERGREEKRGRELLEKRRGTSASLSWRRTGLADEVGSDAIPDTVGGEGGHGAAKPDGVIHRYLFNSSKRRFLLIFCMLTCKI
jgi:hypothetical protein